MSHITVSKIDEV